MAPELLGAPVLHIQGSIITPHLLRLTDEMQTASSFMMFLKNIAGLLDIIVHLLPDYEQLCSAYKRPSPIQSQYRREQRSLLLSYLYTDLAQFFLGLHQMFLRASHGMYFLRTRCPRAGDS